MILSQIRAHILCIYFLGLLVGCSTVPKGLTNLTPPIEAVYSRAADQFEIFDCVFWDGFCSEGQAFRQYWKDHFGFGETELRISSSYSALRARHYLKLRRLEKDPFRNPNGLFAADEVDADPVSDAFLSASSLDEALSSLSNVLSATEQQEFKRIFLDYDRSLSALTQEDAPFAQLPARLNSTLGVPPAQALIDFIEYFYRATDVPRFKVVFTWLPPIDHDVGQPEGHFLVLSRNPKKHLNRTDDDLTLHEFTHVVSSRQDPDQKTKFSGEFLNICPNASKLKRGQILEESLAVALGQMLYLDIIHPERFKTTNKWYGNRWIDHYSRLIYPLVRSYYSAHRQIDSEFINSAAKICARQNIDDYVN